MRAYFTNKCVKFFLSGIFALMACLSLHAEEAAESCIYYGNAVVVGKEYMFEKSASTKTDGAPHEQNKEEKTASDNSSFIFISENTKVCGKEYLYVEQETSSVVKQNASSVTLCVVKKASKIKKETSTPVKNEIARQNSASILFAFPYAPPTACFLQGDSESAVILPQQKLGEDQQVCKTYRKHIYPDTFNVCLFYFPEQRQKLSTTATQCGMLTAFGSNFPPFSTFV